VGEEEGLTTLLVAMEAAQEKSRERSRKEQHRIAEIKRNKKHGGKNGKDEAYDDEDEESIEERDALVRFLSFNPKTANCTEQSIGICALNQLSVNRCQDPRDISSNGWRCSYALWLFSWSLISIPSACSFAFPRLTTRFALFSAKISFNCDVQLCELFSVVIVLGHLYCSALVAKKPCLYPRSYTSHPY
jgi:hypothetical protein